MKKHWSLGVLLPAPTLLMLWAWTFRVERDPTGRSHFLRDDLYLEATTINHHNQKHFQPGLSFSSENGQTGPLNSFIPPRKSWAGCQLPLLCLVYWPRVLSPHNGTEHTTTRTTVGKRKTVVSPAKGTGTSNIPVVASKSSDPFLRKPTFEWTSCSLSYMYGVYITKHCEALCWGWEREGAKARLLKALGLIICSLPTLTTSWIVYLNVCQKMNLY